MGSEDNFTYAMELINGTTLSMVLVNTVKLKVLETIAKEGPDAQLSGRDIASRLSIPNQDAPDMIDRMLRLLATHSIVTCTEGVHESKPIRVYGLTPVGKYFIPNEEGISLGPLAQLVQDKVFVDSWFELEDAVLNGGVPFDKEILEHYRGFDNLECVVDVGGGLGHTLAMIISKHPNIKGINFDLPHVTQHAQLYEGIDHVGGDMFKEVPEGDAIFMKWILHDWSDDHCIKLLKNCYKALPKNGKVIIIEAILPFLPDTSASVKVNTNMDVFMMTVNTGGKERTEDEFLALAKSAGFKGIKKECFLCNFWVMEFYK
ncbi:putative caffeate O-methyltransferase [Helianthus debilis subsp. tardiflorus]